MKNLLVTCLAISFICFSCQKSMPGYTESNYSFDASLTSSTISLPGTANFTIADNPDVISFYSGETGNNYDNRNRTILPGGALKVKFESRVLNKPADTLDVLISNDFSGVYDSTNVANAKWKKMTSKFNFPLPTTALGTFIPSGLVPGDFTDITDSVIAGKPFYFAFKYDINKNNNIEWSISKLAMYNFFGSGIPTAIIVDSNSNNSGNFATVRMGETINRWSRTSTLYKVLNANSSKIGASHWYISRALNPNAVTPDLPIVIKNISQSRLSNFKYRYRTAGTYKAVFVASYNRLNFEKIFLREFTVVVQ